MSTVPVDNSVGKFPDTRQKPTILEKITHWLKNRQFNKLLLLLRYFYFVDGFSRHVTESLQKCERTRVKWKSQKSSDFLAIILAY